LKLLTVITGRSAALDAAPRYGYGDRSRSALTPDLGFMTLILVEFRPCDLDPRSIVLNEIKVGSRLL
jgi:hypothetical protein